MKTTITIFFILFIGAVTQAQNDKKEVKVETITMEVALGKEEVTVKKDNGVARLYMFKNSLVKKELSFTTKNNKPKLA